MFLSPSLLRVYTGILAASTGVHRSAGLPADVPFQRCTRRFVEGRGVSARGAHTRGVIRPGARHSLRRESAIRAGATFPDSHRSVRLMAPGDQPGCPHDDHQHERYLGNVCYYRRAPAPSKRIGLTNHGPVTRSCRGSSPERSGGREGSAKMNLLSGCGIIGAAGLLDRKPRELLSCLVLTQGGERFLGTLCPGKTFRLARA